MLSVSGESGTGFDGCLVVDAKKDGSIVTAGAGANVDGGWKGAGVCVGIGAATGSLKTVGGGAGAAVGCGNGCCNCCNCCGSES